MLATALLRKIYLFIKPFINSKHLTIRLVSKIISSLADLQKSSPENPSCRERNIGDYWTLFNLKKRPYFASSGKNRKDAIQQIKRRCNKTTYFFEQVWECLACDGDENDGEDELGSNTQIEEGEYIDWLYLENLFNVGWSPRLPSIKPAICNKIIYAL